MLRGWKFVGLSATIILYVLGILVLSIVNLQTPRNEKRGRNARYANDVSKFLMLGGIQILRKKLSSFTGGFSSQTRSLAASQNASSAPVVLGIEIYGTEVESL